MCRNGLRRNSAQKLSGVRVHSGLKNGVLVCLRSGKTQILVFVFKRTHIVLIKRIENRASVGVLAVCNITRNILNEVARVASLRSNVIAHILNCALRLAATILKLVAEICNCGVYTGKPCGHRSFGAMEAGSNRVVERIGAIANPLLHSRYSALEAVKSDCLINIRSGCKALHAGIRRSTAAKAAKPAAIVAPHNEVPPNEMVDRLRPPSHPMRGCGFRAPQIKTSSTYRRDTFTPARTVITTA